MILIPVADVVYRPLRDGRLIVCYSTLCVRCRGRRAGDFLELEETPQTQLLYRAVSMRARTVRPCGRDCYIVLVPVLETDTDLEYGCVARVEHGRIVQFSECGLYRRVWVPGVRTARFLLPYTLVDRDEETLSTVYYFLDPSLLDKLPGEERERALMTKILEDPLSLERASSEVLLEAVSLVDDLLPILPCETRTILARLFEKRLAQSPVLAGGRENRNTPY